MANKLILVPEQIYRGLTTHTPDDINMNFVKRNLDRSRNKRENISSKNVHYNQELRRYLLLKNEHDNKPVKVEIAGGPQVIINKKKKEGIRLPTHLDDDDDDDDYFDASNMDMTNNYRPQNSTISSMYDDDDFMRDEYEEEPRGIKRVFDGEDSMKRKRRRLSRKNEKKTPKQIKAELKRRRENAKNRARTERGQNSTNVSVAEAIGAPFVEDEHVPSRRVFKRKAEAEEDEYGKFKKRHIQARPKPKLKLKFPKKEIDYSIRDRTEPIVEFPPSPEPLFADIGPNRLEGRQQFNLQAPPVRAALAAPLVPKNLPKYKKLQIEAAANPERALALIDPLHSRRQPRSRIAIKRELEDKDDLGLGEQKKQRTHGAHYYLSERDTLEKLQKIFKEKHQKHTRDNIILNRKGLPVSGSDLSESLIYLLRYSQGIAKRSRTGKVIIPPGTSFIRNLFKKDPQLQKHINPNPRLKFSQRAAQQERAAEQHLLQGTKKGRFAPALW